MFIYFLLIFVLLGSAKSRDVPDHTIALPMKYWSNVEKLILLSTFPEDKCCGVKLIFKGGVAILDTKNCDDEITCEKSPLLRKVIEKNHCPIGVPADAGCFQTNKDIIKQYALGTAKITSQVSGYTTDCFCIASGVYCQDKYYDDLGCSDMSKYVIDIDDSLIISDGTNLKSTSEINLRLLKVPIIMTETQSDLRSIEVYKNKVIYTIRADIGTICKVHIGSEICDTSCSSELCQGTCKLPKIKTEKNLEKVPVSISCGNWNRKYWLFREKHSEYAGINQLQSHSNWRTTSRLWTTLFIICAILGYPIVYFTILLSFFLYHIVFNLILSSIPILFKYIYKFSFDIQDVCPDCKNNICDIADAILHNEMCCQGLCPYCRTVVEILQKDHIKTCMMKVEKKNVLMKSLSTELVDYRKKHNYALISGIIIRNQRSIRKFTSKVWIFVTLILFVMTLIAPSSAFLDRPCNRLIGSTKSCADLDPKTELQSSPEDHNKNSAYELNIHNKIVDTNYRDPFLINSIHRAKSNYLLLSGDSTESITSVVKHCSDDGTCRSSTTVDWAGELNLGSVSSYKIESDDKHTTTFNLIITGLQMEIPLEYMYSTFDWKVITEDGFSCTNTDCTQVCKLTKDEDACPVKRVSRPRETAWTHNPGWCLSINSGCACAKYRVEKDENSDIIEVHKLGKEMIKAVLCAVQNSVLVDCVEIRHIGTSSAKNIKVEVQNWKTNLNLPLNVAMVYKKSPNVTLVDTYFGDFCKQNHCKLGELGDYQFFKNPICNEKNKHYFDMSQIKSQIHYQFASPPSWSFDYPASGYRNFYENIKNYQKSNTFSLANVNYDINSSMLIIHGDNLGYFSAKILIDGIELYDVKSKAVVEEFKVTHCIGSYGSLLGAICTFSVHMSGQRRATLTVLSKDDSLIIQNDAQMITEGLNVFRKHVFVRSKQVSYEFCYETSSNSEIKCSTIKNNFTEPTNKWRLLDRHSFLSHSEAVPGLCDAWFGINCIVNRAIDLVKTLFSAKWIITFCVSAFLIWVFANFVIRYIFHWINKSKIEIKLSKNPTDRTEIFKKYSHLIGKKEW